MDHEPSVSPATTKRLLWALYGLCFATLVADLFYHKHAYFTVDGYFGIHAAYGFVAFLLIVFVGGALRRVLMRPEDYYESEDGPGD